MSFAELRQLVAWAGDEGWNPGLNDARLFWELDREGFLALAADDDDSVVAGGAIIRHSDTFGFMGLFIVDRPYRGRGWGRQLWVTRRERLLERLSPGATIGLDGVDAMVPFYAKGGFQPFTRHRRFQTTPESKLAFAQRKLVDETTLDAVLVRPLDATFAPRIATYDRHGFPAPRELFLSRWCEQPDALTRVCFRDDQVVGYGVMRRCLSGWKVGPLFADSIDIAARIVQSLRDACPDDTLYVDAPDNNPAASELCRQMAMQEVFGCVRMYHGPPPQLDHARIFGITTLEIG